MGNYVNLGKEGDGYTLQILFELKADHKALTKPTMVELIVNSLSYAKALEQELQLTKDILEKDMDWWLGEDDNMDVLTVVSRKGIVSIFYNGQVINKPIATDVDLADLKELLGNYLMQIATDIESKGTLVKL